MLEERPIVDHRLSQVLRRGCSPLVRYRDVVRRAVVVDNMRMIDGDVGRALFEVVDRVTAIPHYEDDQSVGLLHRLLRLIDETGLSLPPRARVALTSGGIEGPDLELLPALLPR